jgi:hypothetical protein
LVERLAKQKSWKKEEKDSMTEQLQKELWGEFRKAYYRIQGAPGLPREDDDEFLALAQHHGLPTRLLDWTRLPYIGAFFAFDGCDSAVFSPDHEVAIWAIDWDMFELLLYYSYWDQTPEKVVSKKPGELDKVLKSLRNSASPRIDRVRIRGNPNRRMVYQEGLFTRAIKVRDDMEHYIRSKGRYAPSTVLTKIVVPGSQQAEALRDLSLMAINPVTLMNDPDGAAATAFNAVVRFGTK